jgi:hypothetical protein
MLVAILAFQHGRMAWVAPKTIFAWRDDQTWGGKFVDTWDQQRVISGDPPDGCFTPQSGLGNTWAEEELEDRLGYAIQRREVVGSGDFETKTDGWIVRFGSEVYHVHNGEVEPESDEDDDVSPAPNVTEITNWHMVLLSLTDDPDEEPALLFNLGYMGFGAFRCYDPKLKEYQTRVYLRGPWIDEVPKPEQVELIQRDGRWIAVFRGNMGDQLWAQCLAIGARPAIAGYSKGL